MDIRVTLTADEPLLQALANLGNALRGISTPTPIAPSMSGTSTVYVGDPPRSFGTSSVSAPAYASPPPMQSAPPSIQQAPVQQAPAPLPTSAPTYTLDDIMRAASSLADAGKRDQVLGLIAQFGVPTLMQIPPEQYGNFAAGLRSLGAQL